MGKCRRPVHNPEYFHTFLHSFTFVALEDEGIEYKIGCKIKHLQVEPGWRNWQTQRTQNPPTFGSWGFDSPSRHHAVLQRTGFSSAARGWAWWLWVRGQSALFCR